MDAVHNFKQTYQLQHISHKNLITSKNYISTTANTILKYASLLKVLIRIGVIFSLAYKTEGHVLADTITTTTAKQLDDVIIDPLQDNPTSLCGTLCRIFRDIFGNR